MPSPVTARLQPRARWCPRGLLALVCLYGLLLIPEPAPPVPQGAGQPAFLWNQNEFWSNLETTFRAARSGSGVERAARFQVALEPVHRALDLIAATNLPPSSPAFAAVETKFYELAPVAAACPERVADFMAANARMRHLVKWQSERWPLDTLAARQQLYRLLYGGRAATEEVLLQCPRSTNAPEVNHTYDHSVTPGILVQGVKLHSGDVLVSRGGAATSALIARGNDFPGNFSHIALLHVDETTQAASVIESHIESGVGVRSLEEYLADTKLRILALRMRSHLPALAADPLLPHHAASLAMSNARARHIPYDFAMDYADPAKQFCSEVAAAAYQPLGVTLWMNLSHLSTPGVTSWLAALGVRNFETQEPSDLEYDPQLRVVAEWRDPDTLFQDHLDNAVVDAMLEGAERGDKLTYNLWLLPAVRLAKAWSVLLNCFGQVGPIPEGMSATTALRVKKLTQDHADLKRRLAASAQVFQTQNGYRPPYWELVSMARAARAK